MPPLRHAYVTIGVELLNADDPELGLWCAPCALPSAAALDYLLIINGTPHGIVRRVVCLDCGEVTDG